jgi:hypothetical protein
MNTEIPLLESMRGFVFLGGMKPTGNKERLSEVKIDTGS